MGATLQGGFSETSFCINGIMSADISMDNNCQKQWLLVPALGTNLEGRQLEEERREELHPSAGVPDPQRSGGPHATENQGIHHDPRDLGSSPLSLAQLVVPGSSAQPPSPTGLSPHGSAQPPSPVIQALLESSVSDRGSSQQALHQALLVRALQQVSHHFCHHNNGSSQPLEGSKTPANEK